jgi:hypothetical protein
MMSLFPAPYPDEILYNVIARYRIRSGNISHRSTLKDVFGSDDFTASLELQPGISRLVSNLPVGSMVTAEQLIHENTMYLFYTAFRSEEQAQTILHEMTREHGRDIHNSVGLMSSAVKPSLFFRHCTQCDLLDLEEYGERYWRRIHQIPGVNICTKHGVWLCDSKVSIRGANKYVFTEPTEENCPLDKVEIVIQKQFLERYSLLINNIEKLLRTSYPHRPMEWFHGCYKQRLIDKGYANKNGRVDHISLRSDFKGYYGEDLLHILQCSIEGDSNWLKLIFQKHRKGFAPIRHLILMQFLGLALEDVFFWNEQSSSSKGLLTVKSKRKISKKNMTLEYKQQAGIERREAWLKMSEENPELSRTQIRKLEPKIYAWLYLYDRQFLMEESPEPVAPKAGYARIDWGERDQVVLRQAQDAVELLLKLEEKPRRISMMRIQEVIGRQCLMPKHLKKMPLTKAYLEEVVEDSEKFGERRIQWAIEEFKREGQPLKWWRIIRRAGIRRYEYMHE